MYKIATYNTKNASRLYYLLNETMVRERLDSVVSDDVFVIKQDENEVIPEQRMVGNELLLQLPSEYLTSGFSALQLKGDHKKWLAFNYDQQESDVRQIGQEALQNYADQHKNVTLFASSDANTFSKEIKARYLGQPLWKFAILLALFFLLMEILIIRYMK